MFDATREVIGPLLLAMLSVLAVFVPSFFMTGVSRALFVPLSLAVGFAMAASYVLSSSLVPVLSVWTLRSHRAHRGSEHRRSRSSLKDGLHGFSAGYARMLQRLVRVRWLVIVGYLAAAGAIVGLLGPRLGLEIFPQVVGRASSSCGSARRPERASN